MIWMTSLAAPAIWSISYMDRYVSAVLIWQRDMLRSHGLLNVRSPLFSTINATTLFRDIIHDIAFLYVMPSIFLFVDVSPTRYTWSMPHYTRGGMIMNRVIIILSLVVLTGSVAPDLSRAHSHVQAQPQSEGPSLILAEPAEFIGPVLKGEEVLKLTEQPSWNRLSLTHTDTNYLPASERHHPALYRSFIAPDGVALMFSWPFASVSTFWMNPQGSSNESTLNQDHSR